MSTDSGNRIGDGIRDWDLRLYYRGAIDLAALATRGVVCRPRSWARVVDGGACLRCAGETVDVILRDLGAVEHWTRRAEQGEFEESTNSAIPLR